MGYHMAVTDLKNGGTLEELATLPDQGVTSYKLFMAYKGALMVDDETLFRTMQVAADTGALVMVHAENGDAIDVLVKEALAAGNTEPKYHALTRPPETEGEATNRAIQLARVAGSPLYVVHVSCRESVEPIARARDAGWNIHGETCTQYLFIDYTFLERPNFEGAKYVYTPPPRAKENQDVLWNAVRTDVLSAISTDHCAFRWDGQKTLGRDDFSKIPNGGPGIENRLHMIHEFGARQGRISLNRMVELLATNPAKLFGLYPRKGTIAVGSDADIVVFDPERTAHALGGDAPLEGRLQPLRGHRGDAERSTSSCCAGRCSSTGTSSSREPGRRPVRPAREVRRGAEARTRRRVATRLSSHGRGLTPAMAREAPPSDAIASLGRTGERATQCLEQAMEGSDPCHGSFGPELSRVSGARSGGACARAAPSRRRLGPATILRLKARMPAIRAFWARTVDPEAIAASSRRSCGAMPLPLRSAVGEPARARGDARVLLDLRRVLGRHDGRRIEALEAPRDRVERVA